MVACLTGAYSQPRIAGPPGGIPIPLRPLPYRNERLVSGAGVGGGPNVGLVRFRRPVLAARQQQLPLGMFDFNSFFPRSIWLELKEKKMKIAFLLIATK